MAQCSKVCCVQLIDRLYCTRAMHVRAYKYGRACHITIHLAYRCANRKWWDSLMLMDYRHVTTNTGIHGLLLSLHVRYDQFVLRRPQACMRRA